MKSLEAMYLTGLLSVCIATPHLVQTLDNVTYHHDLSDCNTLLSSDCSESPRYALFAKKRPGSNFLGVKFYIGGHSLEIPEAHGGEIIIDGNKITMAENSLHSYPEDLPYLQIGRKMKSYVVYSNLVEVHFEFTEGRVLLTLPSLYRNHHCGLCGNFDGEQFGEYISPEQCPLPSGELLSNSYALNDGSCTAPPHPKSTCHQNRRKRDVPSTDFLLHQLMKKGSL
jgi:hypothetical protein